MTGRPDHFFTAEVPADLLAEMRQNALEVFERNLHPYRGMDHALASTYLDGVLVGALFVLGRPAIMAAITKCNSDAAGTSERGPTTKPRK